MSVVTETEAQIAQSETEARYYWQAFLLKRLEELAAKAKQAQSSSSAPEEEPKTLSDEDVHTTALRKEQVAAWSAYGETMTAEIGDLPSLEEIASPAYVPTRALAVQDLADSGVFDNLAEQIADLGSPTDTQRGTVLEAYKAFSGEAPLSKTTITSVVNDMPTIAIPLSLPRTPALNTKASHSLAA